MRTMSAPADSRSRRRSCPETEGPSVATILTRLSVLTLFLPVSSRGLFACFLRDWPSGLGAIAPFVYPQTPECVFPALMLPGIRRLNGWWRFTHALGLASH